MTTRLGILGGGQLAKMLAASAAELGVRARAWDPSPDAVASFSAALVTAPWDDADAADRFSDGLTAATYEFENVPAVAAARVASRAPLFPQPRALKVSSDRAREKSHFESIGIPVGAWTSISSEGDVRAAESSFAFPAILKTRAGGYDGKGQRHARRAHELGDAWRDLGCVPAVLETLVPFTRELSVIVARDRQGHSRTWAVCENAHAGGILRTTIAPADISADTARASAGYACALADSLDYVGVLALELFEVDGSLLANEFAPRVHNTGHWTIEAAHTSQFENHVRAVLGLPLGSTSLRSHAGMINIIGTAPTLDRLAGLDGAAVRVYGKAPRPGRKLGHVTVTGDTVDDVRARIDRVRATLEPFAETAS